MERVVARENEFESGRPLVGEGRRTHDRCAGIRRFPIDLLRFGAEAAYRDFLSVC